MTDNKHKVNEEIGYSGQTQIKHKLYQRITGFILKFKIILYVYTNQ